MPEQRSRSPARQPRLPRVHERRRPRGGLPLAGAVVGARPRRRRSTPAIRCRRRRRRPAPGPPSAGGRRRARAISSAWRPLSTTRPSSRTRMRSAPITLESRCAKISVVRPAMSRSSASWIDRLALRVHRRQRLVEHEDGRVAQQRPRDGDALALAAREAHAALAHDRLRSPGAARAMNSWALAARAAASSSAARGVGLAHAEVVLDGAVEEIGVLADHRDVRRAARRGASVAHVAPAHEHARRPAGRGGAAAGARSWTCPRRSVPRCPRARRRPPRS